MIYKARHAEVNAIALTISEPGPTHGDGLFAVRTLTGDTVALVDREAFVSMCVRSEPEVPLNVEAPARALWDDGKSTPKKLPAKKAVKKATSEAAFKEIFQPGGLIDRIEARSPPSINDAICIALKGGALTTKELAIAVDVIRPGSKAESVYAAVSPCIHKNLIHRRASDNKLELVP